MSLAERFYEAGWTPPEEYEGAMSAYGSARVLIAAAPGVEVWTNIDSPIDITNFKCDERWRLRGPDYLFASRTHIMDYVHYRNTTAELSDELMKDLGKAAQASNSDAVRQRISQAIGLQRYQDLHCKTDTKDDVAAKWDGTQLWAAQWRETTLSDNTIASTIHTTLDLKKRGSLVSHTTK